MKFLSELASLAMGCFLGTFELIKLAAPALSVGAALFGVWIARAGLNTWRKQRDAELAKKLAATVYQYRLSLHKIRAPSHTPEDIILLNGADLPSAVDDELRILRWRAARMKRSELEALLAEADLHWKGAATNAFSDASLVDSKLFFYIDEFRMLNIREEQDRQNLLNRQMNEERWQGNSQKADRRFLELTSLLNDSFNSDDVTRKEIDESFDKMTKFLRSHI